MDDECADCGAELDSGSMYLTGDWDMLEDGSVVVLYPPIGRWVCGDCWEKIPSVQQAMPILDEVRIRL